VVEANVGGGEREKRERKREDMRRARAVEGTYYSSPILQFG
jgi:hypothetical protein